jgi:hypothetical protein
MQVSRALTMQAAPVNTGQRTAMSFDVDLRRHSVTVSVVDRNSGEVLQQVVYDRHLSSAQQKTRRAGATVDLQV